MKDIKPTHPETLNGIRHYENSVDLAAYRKTGLSPEEVAELARAKNEGRMVVLPCKLGTPSYWAVLEASICNEPYDCDGCPWYEYTGYPDDANDELDACCGWKPHIQEQPFSYASMMHYGKTLFLTREAAEAALAAQKEGKE